MGNHSIRVYYASHPNVLHFEFSTYLPKGLFTTYCPPEHHLGILFVPLGFLLVKRNNMCIILSLGENALFLLL